MRRSQLLIVFAAIALLVGSSQADAVDPQIIIGGGNTTTVFLTGGTVNLSFTAAAAIPQGCSYFLSPGPSGMDEMGCGFVNQTGSTLLGLVFNISPAFQLPLTLSCSICSVPPTFSQNGAVITFTFIPGLIANSDDFFVQFIGFSQGTGIGVTPIPEPGTIALLLTGLGALGLRRRRVQRHT